MKKLKLDQITIDAGTQTRVTLNEDTIIEYAEAMTEGAKFPAVVVFASGTDYLLADGFHRFMAVQRCGWKEIGADIRKGSRLDAIKYSLGANNGHGLRRSNADKRRCVEIALREFGKLSDRAIAQICGISHEFVRQERAAQVSTVDTSNSQSPIESDLSSPPAFRTGLDGKSYPVCDMGPPPVPPAVEKDPNGKTIPGKLLPLWARRHEVQAICTQLSKFRTTIAEAAHGKDMLYAELNQQQVKAALDQAYTAIKATMPYCLCPSCQGEGCRACAHRGLIGKFRYDMVIPKELKQ